MLSDRTFTHIQGKHGNKFTSEVENLMDEIADIERLKPIGYEFHVIALIFMLCQRFYQYYELFKGKTKAMVNPDILLYRRISDFIARNIPECKVYFARKRVADRVARLGGVIAVLGYYAGAYIIFGKENIADFKIDVILPRVIAGFNLKPRKFNI